MKIALTLVWIILITPVNVFAERLTTNIDDVIIKNVECKFFNLNLVVSNKSTVPLNKKLIVTVFDSDGDPVDNSYIYINLGSVSGERITFNNLTCSNEHSYAFRFE